MNRSCVRGNVDSIIGGLSLTSPAVTKPKETKRAMLVSLPTELLQHIASFLSNASAASLTLSSRLIRRALGDQHWLSLKDVTCSDERRDFLAMLERDLPGYVLCHCCNRLHRWLAEESPRRTSAWGAATAQRECVMRDQLKLEHVPAYDLSFRHCQLVMNAHRYGPKHGILLDALSHVWRYSHGESTTQVFISARIAFDELILRVRFRIPMVFNKLLEDIRWNDVEICPHLCATAHNARLQNLLICNLSHGSNSKCSSCTIPKHCHWCATEYLLETHSFRDKGLVVVVTAWKNLGMCRTPLDPKWQGHAGNTQRGILSPVVAQEELKGIRDAFELLADVVGSA